MGRTVQTAGSSGGWLVPRAPVVVPGDRFGRLVVLAEHECRATGRTFVCRCDCGVERVVESANLRRGNTRSCGCLNREPTRGSSRHGLSKTGTHRSWRAMLSRCTNPNASHWEHYGGRGIVVCDRWRSFENFLADLGLRPEGTTLDRIDVNGNYEPGNCRWATAKEQAANRRDRAGMARRLLFDRELSPAARCVGLVLLDRCELGRRELEELVGLSEKVVLAAAGELAARGLVESERLPRAQGRPKVYRLVCP